MLRDDYGFHTLTDGPTSFLAASYVYELRVTVLTVNVTDETVPFKLFLVTVQVPAEFVVHDPEPAAPVLQVPPTVAFASGL